MQRQEKSHVILVSYSGYISTPSSLALDNGLASLAGALIARGNKVLIEDYNTVGMFERMTPPNITELAEAIRRASRDPSRRDGVPCMIRCLQRTMEAHRDRVADKVFETLAEKIEEHGTRVVGFKCWAGDGLAAVKRWCMLLRERFPDVKILLGGPCCQIAPEPTARFIRDFDYMVTCDGEHVIGELMDHIEGSRDYLGGIPGTLRLVGDVVVKRPATPMADLDQTPRPVYDRDVYPSAWTGEKLKLAILDESRGCPMKCHFCVHPMFAGGWRQKTVGRLIQEIKHLQRTLGIRYFRLAGSYTPPQLLFELAQAVLAEKLDVRLSCFMHANGMKEEYLDTLYRAGLRAVFYGVESADDRLLKTAANKRTSSDRLYRILKATSDSGIFVTGSFIFPLPFESAESRQNTLDFTKRLFSNNGRASAQFLNPIPLPGTAWWNQRDTFGFGFDEVEYIDRLLNIRLRNMYPPEFQDLLPFTLNGKTHRELAFELGALLDELKNDDILFDITDELALIAAGCGQDPAAFRDDMRRAFLYGDGAVVRRMVATFNANKCAAQSDHVRLLARVPSERHEIRPNRVAAYARGAGLPFNRKHRQSEDATLVPARCSRSRVTRIKIQLQGVKS